MGVIGGQEVDSITIDSIIVEYLFIDSGLWVDFLVQRKDMHDIVPTHAVPPPQRLDTKDV